MNRDAAEGRLEVLAWDRRLGVALVGDDGDDPLRIEQPARVSGWVGSECGIARGDNRVLRRFAAQKRGARCLMSSRNS
jgi:hypothetical protein